MLVRKQVHLESQQHKLMQWAAELQRREMELQVCVSWVGGLHCWVWAPALPSFSTKSSKVGSTAVAPLWCLRVRVPSCCLSANSWCYPGFAFPLQRQAQAEGRPFTAPSAAFQSATSAPATLAPLGSPDRLGDGVPAPIPSESPIFPRLRRSQAAATMAAAANGSSRADLSSAAAGAAPDSVPGVEHPGSSQGVGPGSSGDQPPKTPLTHSR